MRQFLLILRGDTTLDYSKFTPDDMQRIIAQYGEWSEGMAKQGLLLSGQKLTDEGGKVLTPKTQGIDAELDVKDGPYIETKEVVGGIYLIKAEDYDHAAKLCKRHPNFEFGSIEIREVDFMGQPPE